MDEDNPGSIHCQCGLLSLLVSWFATTTLACKPESQLGCPNECGHRTQGTFWTGEHFQATTTDSSILPSLIFSSTLSEWQKRNTKPCLPLQIHVFCILCCTIAAFAASVWWWAVSSLYLPLLTHPNLSFSSSQHSEKYPSCSDNFCSEPSDARSKLW